MDRDPDARRAMFDGVDPFIGTTATALPTQTGLAATWWWPKPQVGNTHPGATYPLGMVSACAYSGGYPTGYGLYDLVTEGVPTQIHDRLLASGFTHFQQSGTGAIRKYYNYFRVTPMLQALDELGTLWEVEEEGAEPGWYAATLASGIRCEVTSGPRAPCTATPSRDTAMRDSSSTSPSAARRSRTGEPPPAGASACHRPGGRAGRDRRRGRAAGPCTSSATPRSGGRYSGTIVG